MKKVVSLVISVVMLLSVCLGGCANNSVTAGNQEPASGVEAEIPADNSVTASENVSVTAVGAADADGSEETKAAVDEIVPLVDIHEGNRKIIIDTDTAGDDAVAMLIAAEADGIDIMGITVVAGNVSIDQAVNNALQTMEIAKRPDIPVYKGATTAYDGTDRETYSVFGSDGMGDKDLIHPSGKAQKEDAADFIISMAKRYPGEVEIVALGPVTNIANAITKDPEAMKGIRKIWSMGTAGLGPGNATPVAEFNVYKDAEAYNIMLSFDVPKTIIGLDMLTEDTYLTDYYLNKMATEGTEANKFIAEACESLADHKLETLGKRFADMPDPIAMACAVWPGFILDSINTSAFCITADDSSHGQVIFFKEGTFYDSVPDGLIYNTELVTKIASGTFVVSMCYALENLIKKQSDFDLDRLTCMVDLHLHLDGAISVESAKALAKAQNIEIPGSDEEIEKLLRVSDNCRSLAEFLEKFEFPLSLLQTPEAVKQAVAQLIKEEQEQGVMYCEIRFAPSLCGNDMDAVVAAACEAVNEAEIPCGLILCFMRGDGTHDVAIKTLYTAQKYLGKGVVGFDMAGDEAAYATADYEDVFALAKYIGVPFTIHAGEADGAGSIASAIVFGASRIGHGVRALENDLVVETLAKRGITLEMCPTSNIITKAVESYQNYPITMLHERGVKVTINTDDPSVEGTTIKEEFKHIIDAFNLSDTDVKTLLMNAVNAAFCEESVKVELRKKIESELADPAKYEK